MLREQSLASVELYLLAAKFDMPCMTKFARRSLQQSLNLSSADGWTGTSSEALDPWQIACYASQCNDQALVDFCMDLVVAPLSKGKTLAVPPEYLALPALSVLLLSKINCMARCHGGFASHTWSYALAHEQLQRVTTETCMRTTENVPDCRKTQSLVHDCCSIEARTWIDKRPGYLLTLKSQMLEW